MSTSGSTGSGRRGSRLSRTYNPAVPDARFRVNAELTAAKAFDDEVVIINTATGRYYDLAGSGAIAWTMLERGASADEISDVLASAYGIPDATAREDVGQLLQQLSAEDLVVMDESPRARNGHEAGDPPAVVGDYTPPMLATYTDMEDLLAADPPLPSGQPPAAAPHLPSETGAPE